MSLDRVEAEMDEPLAGMGDSELQDYIGNCIYKMGYRGPWPSSGSHEPSEEDVEEFWNYLQRYPFPNFEQRIQGLTETGRNCEYAIAFAQKYPLLRAKIDNLIRGMNSTRDPLIYKKGINQLDAIAYPWRTQSVRPYPNVISES